MIGFSLQYEDGTPAIKSSIVTGGGEERLEREQAELRQGPDGLGIQGISEAGCHLYIVTAPACTKLSNGNGQSKAGEDHSILRDGLITWGGTGPGRLDRIGVKGFRFPGWLIPGVVFEEVTKEDGDVLA